MRGVLLALALVGLGLSTLAAACGPARPTLPTPVSVSTPPLALATFEPTLLPTTTVPMPLATAVPTATPTLQATPTATAPAIPTPSATPSPAAGTVTAAARSPLTVVKEERVNLPPKATPVALSPDGNQILLILSTDRTRPLTTPVAGDRDVRVVTLATVNADGSGLRQLNPDGEAPVGDRPYLGQPAYSPDGRLVAYLTYHDGTHASLHVIASDGTQPRALGLADYGTLYWLQDRIVFARDNRFWTVRPDGSDAAPVGNGQPGKGNRSALSPDGKRLASVGGDAGDKLILSDSDGANVRTLVTQPMSGNLIWSPDSQWIAYTALGDYALHVANRAGTDDWLVDDEIGTHFVDWHWSPDARFLVYSAVPSATFAVCYSSVRGGEPMARAKADIASGVLIDWAPRARKMLVARCGEPAFDSQGNPQVETWLLSTLEGNDLETGD